MTNSNKKTICFITSCLKLGGLENAVTVMVKYFYSKNYFVNVITIYKYPHFYKLNPKIKVIEPQFPKKNVSKYLYYFRIVLFLRREIKKNLPDRIIAYGDWSNFLVLIAVKGLRIKTFISDRASPGLKFPFHVKLLRRLFYPGASGIIAQTYRAAQQKRDMLGTNINVSIIPNPVRPIIINPNIEKENIILAVARHYPEKGLDRLIKVFALLEIPGWVLHIAGSNGPETQYLNRLVKNLKLKNKVIFLGGVKDIDLVYSRSSIFVLPSYHEGFPNALIEAMAHGLACISFDINSGPSEIIENGVNGLLVADGDIEAFTKNIQLLIQDISLRRRLGKEAQKIKETLSLDKIGKLFEDFIFENND
jgi:GalNAc-alpha-(1->4)-GalNAc-alpha-(1->3)-diNAcBac-PP-undecaprenol alpha-1,4-N-acetyl-D-galactosaminyltransferase